MTLVHIADRLVLGLRLLCGFIFTFDEIIILYISLDGFKPVNKDMTLIQCFCFSRLCHQPQLISRTTHTTLFQHPGFLANCCAFCSATPHQRMVLSKVAWLNVWRRFSIRHRNHRNPKRCSTLMQRMPSCLRLSPSLSTMTGESPFT